MKSLSKALILSLIAVDIFLLGKILLHGQTIAVLQPKGMIAQQELQLLLIATILSMVIVIPVVSLIFIFTFRYRDGKKRRYTPDWDHDNKLQLLWWALPAAIIFTLSYFTITTTFHLDPKKPLTGDSEPMTIQVVALQWKWLFIYPKEHIATINYVVFPEKTPVIFELTADAPMNSFWIPQLGGQLYAMSGMVNKTHLMASETGEYKGVSAEISGEGFASMRFTAKATTQSEYQQWVASVQRYTKPLGTEEYSHLAKPSEHEQVTFYSPVDATLYNDIVMKYMPTETHHMMHEMVNPE